MRKLTNEKINTVLLAIALLGSGFNYWQERTAKSEVQYGVQNQQIIALNDKFEEWTKFFDKRLDRIESKLDSRK